MKTDMRVAVTKRMLREGLLRCMETQPISRITVSDLCRESGINRATFYNHYDSPLMILREIAFEYAEQLVVIYHAHTSRHDGIDDTALEACFEYIAASKAAVKVLFSENAENYLAGFCMEIINEKAAEKSPAEYSDEQLLCTATTASAVYGFILVWITTEIDKSPKELVRILKKVVRGNVFM